MEKEIIVLKKYLLENQIIDSDVLLNITKENLTQNLENQIIDKNSKLNKFIEIIIDDNNILELKNLGVILNNCMIKLNFAIHKINLKNLDFLKTYMNYVDDNTYTNKGSIIKSIIKQNDLDGLNIILKNNFITGRNIDKYINFAINSGKYDLVPKLIERKKFLNKHTEDEIWV